MKLVTKKMEKNLPKLYSQENVKNPMVVAKFFHPFSNWTWYVIEGEKRDNDFLFFGLVDGHEAELGYFTLSQLQSIKRPIGVERDLYFTPKRLSEVKKEINR